MSSLNTLNKVEILKAELDSLRPLKSDIEQRVLQKIRLDWNYNAVAGKRNSLNLEETKALILHGVTKGSKPLKEYIEMKIHNDTISWVFEVASLGFTFTEDFIKQIHESILLEPYEIESVTKEGKPHIKMVEIGKYKQTPNDIYGRSGQILDFATPEETPEKMKELVEWYSIKSTEKEVNPVILAAEFHYRLVKIQPFDDANGRIAKFLTNLILMHFGFPPMVIKQSDKYLYDFALQKADTGEIEPFIEFIAKNVATSLELFIKGAKGESIEEVDTLEKDLIALEKRLRKLSSKIVKREKVVLLDIFDKSILPLLSKLLENYGKFDRFYIDKKVATTITSLSNTGTNGSGAKKTRSAKTITHLRELLLNEPIELNPAIILEYNYSNLNRDGFGNVKYSNQIVIHFDELEYKITEKNGTNFQSEFLKKYSEELNQSEIDQILNNSAEAHKKFIEQKISGIEIEEENLIKL